MPAGGRAESGAGFLASPPLHGACVVTAGVVWVRFPWGGDEEESRSHDAEPGRPVVRVFLLRTGAASRWGLEGTMGLASRRALPGDRVSSSSSFSTCCMCIVLMCLVACCALVARTMPCERLGRGTAAPANRWLLVLCT